MAKSLRYALSICIVFIVVVIPIAYYRYDYDTNKRLRVVVPGHVYRSGQMTAAGFRDAVTTLHIKTVINVQDDYPDPDIEKTFWDSTTIKESALCQQLSLRYVSLSPDLISRREIPEHRPKVIDEFLDLLDDQSIFPILIHCKAGLHRTGLLTAIYRMEYQGWSRDEAFEELRLHGFGDWVSTCANDYIMQYVVTFQPGMRHGVPVTKPFAPAAESASASGR